MDYPKQTSNVVYQNETNMKNADQPIYPIVINGHIDANDSGLTKREYFAAMALQGILANHTLILSMDKTCELSTFYADELLKQLES